MSSLKPVLSLSQPTEVAVIRIMQQLSAHGFQVERTFDLKAARLAHVACPCPHHGAQGCTCQMVVLIVHSETQLATVIAHGQEERTFLSVVEGTNQSMNRRVFQALLPAANRLEN